MIERFQTCIIDRAYPKDECDALLSTVCQAKGLEWPVESSTTAST